MIDMIDLIDRRLSLRHLPDRLARLALVFALGLLVATLATACATADDQPPRADEEAASGRVMNPDSLPAPSELERAAEAAALASPAEPPPEGLATATFAGGCFWCMEPPYDDLDGVLATTSGYAGGEMDDPSYRQVASGQTSHLEAIRVTYDPEVVSYEELLRVFWRNIDPLDDGGQFCDRGLQYTTAVFVADAEQRRLAEASLDDVAERFDEPIVTDIVPLEEFWPAEDYHQDFYRKDPTRYKSYRLGCRRDARLEQLWGDEAGG